MYNIIIIIIIVIQKSKKSMSSETISMNKWERIVLLVVGTISLILLVFLFLFNIKKYFY